MFVVIVHVALRNGGAEGGGPPLSVVLKPTQTLPGRSPQTMMGRAECIVAVQPNHKHTVNITYVISL